MELGKVAHPFYPRILKTKMVIISEYLENISEYLTRNPGSQLKASEGACISNPQILFPEPTGTSQYATQKKSNRLLQQGEKNHKLHTKMPI